MIYYNLISQLIHNNAYFLYIIGTDFVLKYNEENLNSNLEQIIN